MIALASRDRRVGRRRITAPRQIWNMEYIIRFGQSAAVRYQLRIQRTVLNGCRTIHLVTDCHSMNVPTKPTN